MSKIDILLCGLFVVLALAGCGRNLGDIGQAPELTPPISGSEANAMMVPGLPFSILPPAQPEGISAASLWTGDRGSLLGDRRALQRGDILTVVIDIDDGAQITNSTDRARSSSQDLAIPSLFGLPQRAAESLPGGASLDPAVELGSTSTFAGDGSIRRNEQLTLRLAATVVDVLPNGVLRIEGSQQVRVNFEMRELIVSGFVRPADITRQNEITYDHIAAARISYGGEGQISEVQQPRYGQQAAEMILPF
jgi:flagellar L-ring protein precursor FlgH